MGSVTEKTIQAALMVWAMQERSHTFVLPNVTTLFPWEADLISVTRAGLTHEYEIKLTAADYRRDADKWKHTLMRGASALDARGPCYFWYATHGFEIEPPENAGWLRVECVDGAWRVVEVKAAPRLHGRRAGDRHWSWADVARLLSFRITNHYKRFFVEGGGVSRAENSRRFQVLRFERDMLARQLAERQEGAWSLERGEINRLRRENGMLRDALAGNGQRNGHTDSGDSHESGHSDDY